MTSSNASGPSGVEDDWVGQAHGQGGIRTHGTLAGTPVFETGRFNRSRTCPRMGWDSNPRNGYPFTRSPGVCLQPLGHPSQMLEAQRHRSTGVRTHEGLCLFASVPLCLCASVLEAQEYNML